MIFYFFDFFFFGHHKLTWWFKKEIIKLLHWSQMLGILESDWHEVVGKIKWNSEKKKKLQLIIWKFLKDKKLKTKIDLYYKKIYDIINMMQPLTLIIIL